MSARLVETELPIACSWCSKPLHAYLEVSAGDHDASVILCQHCDAPAAPMVRRRVVSFGHLEEQGDVFVWVEGHAPASRPKRGEQDMPSR
jgi:NAD-dependent SIR2 family protein deacetylase